MDVLVVRHGLALDREDAEKQGMLDRDRPLTERGRKRMKRAARGLSRIAPDIVSLFSSPFRRAVETAELVEREYSDLEHAETNALTPDTSPEDLAHFLAESIAEARVAIVGHEPQLSSFVGYCVTGEPRSVVALGKGGACLLSFDDAPGPKMGRLEWVLPPSALRHLRWRK
jgi:phosphohistidine phosphatase